MNQESTQVRAPEIGGLVLAGGKSQRMGEDKALLDWQGKPLLQRVCQIAQICCCQVQVLSPWPERYRGIVPEEYLKLQEHQPGAGPVVALQQGLAEMGTEWILLLACDLPHLRADLIQGWAQQLEQLPKTVVAVIPHHGGRWEPLCGFYRSSVQADLEDYLQTGGRSFQQWLPRLHTYPLAVDLEVRLMLWNCNSPADLKQTLDSGLPGTGLN